jgi:hypothetical protein
MRLSGLKANNFNKKPADSQKFPSAASPAQPCAKSNPAAFRFWPMPLESPCHSWQYAVNSQVP